MELEGEPTTTGVGYQFGMGLRLDGRDASTPDPAANTGFGQAALGPVYFLEDGALTAFDAANGFQPLTTAATGFVIGRHVVFVLPGTELGSGEYRLQAFGRRGTTASSPAGDTTVGGALGP